MNSHPIGLFVILKAAAASQEKRQRLTTFRLVTRRCRRPDGAVPVAVGSVFIERHAVHVFGSSWLVRSSTSGLTFEVNRKVQLAALCRFDRGVRRHVAPPEGFDLRLLMPLTNAIAKTPTDKRNPAA